MKYLIIVGAIVVLLAIFKITLFKTIWKIIEKVLLFIGKTKLRAVATIFVVSFCFNAAITVIIGESPPHIHDEFANLLAADTFCRGRVSNPQHPHWQFFEAIHILSRPAYVSKYPPAQGLMFAIGQVLFNKPIVGAWLAAALACAGICWALFGWMPSKWAVFGGLLALFHPVILKWSQVFWGGSEAMFGGALLFGAVGYLLKAIDFKNVILLAVGISILGISRPFEGLVLTIICCCFLAYQMFKRKWLCDFKLYFPAGIVFLIFIIFIGYYNWRITGKALKMPYMVYEEQYAVAPFLVFQKPRAIQHYEHEFIKKHFIDYAFEEYNRQQTLKGFAKETIAKYKRLARGYLENYILLIPLLTFPFMFKRSGVRLFPLVAFLIFSAVMVVETWMWDRYVAPAGVLFFCLLVEGFRRLRLCRCRNKPIGFAIVIAVLVLCLLQTVLWLKVRKWEYAKRDWDWQRVQIIKKLEGEGRKHLIFVKYGPNQSVHNDWVHNSADIDGQTVVWARDMGEKNKVLIDYYKDRKLWLLEADNEYDPPPDKIKPAVLKPY